MSGGGSTLSRAMTGGAGISNGALTTEIMSPRVESTPSALRTSVSMRAISSVVRAVMIGAGAVCCVVSGAGIVTLSATSTATVSFFTLPMAPLKLSTLLVFSYDVAVVLEPAPCVGLLGVTSAFCSLASAWRSGSTA